MNFLTDLEISGFPLWVVLLICAGVFLAAFMDSIAGGGGIISVPTYLLAFNGLPTYFALGTNKLSSCIGLFISSGRFIKTATSNGSWPCPPSSSPCWGPWAAPGCSTIRRMWC